MASALDRRLEIINEAQMRQFGRDLALALRPGDVIALSGGLGAGKSTLARAILRALAGDDRLEVPSPTFTILQAYELPDFPVAHFDLYRLGETEELDDIGLEDALAEGAALIEWPEIAEGRLPETRLDLTIDLAADPTERPSARIVSIKSASPEIAARYGQSLDIRVFLAACGHPDAPRQAIAGDASVRNYERVGTGEGSMILMDAPEIPNGPAILGGRSYTDIAHVNRTVDSFIAVAVGLADQGFAAPVIFGQDVESGLLLLEDFGSETIAPDGLPDPVGYGQAVELLADLHAVSPPEELPLEGELSYLLPAFDYAAMRIEIQQLLDWYVPDRTGKPPSSEAADAFDKVWGDLLASLQTAEHGWVLRDYHSPNLMWLDRPRCGYRIGLIDFQDAMIGPVAYDLASLVQDARVTVPAELEERLFDRYVARRKAADPDFDVTDCRRALAIAAAQRATKILGAFTRLAKRDGKPAYLGHRRRVATYLERTLAHPALLDLQSWFDKYLPFEAGKTGS